MTVAARATAPMKQVILRSKRVAMRRRSFEPAEHALDDIALPVDGLRVEWPLESPAKKIGTRCRSIYCGARRADVHLGRGSFRC